MQPLTLVGDLENINQRPYLTFNYATHILFPAPEDSYPMERAQPLGVK